MVPAGPENEVERTPGTGDLAGRRGLAGNPREEIDLGDLVLPGVQQPLAMSG